MFYKKWLKEQNDKLYQQELAEKDREIQHYKELYETVRVANHKVMHRQAAIERHVVKVLEKIHALNIHTEFSDELSLVLKDIKCLSREYQNGINKIKTSKKLPSTNIKMIDDIFKLFAERFENNKIDFNLKINGSIIYMVENIINQNKLETMIGDHLQDALIAINSNNDSNENAPRNVLAVLGEVGDCYEFSVHDSGIPFTVDTLMRLGTEYITTHSDTGGSGIGFMTTFESMRETGASLIINEKRPGSASFSKSVTIRFDGRNQYVIKTYRPEEFQVQDERYVAIGNQAI